MFRIPGSYATKGWWAPLVFASTSILVMIALCLFVVFKVGFIGAIIGVVLIMGAVAINSWLSSGYHKSTHFNNVCTALRDAQPLIVVSDTGRVKDIGNEVLRCLSRLGVGHKKLNNLFVSSDDGLRPDRNIMGSVKWLMTNGKVGNSKLILFILPLAHAGDIDIITSEGVYYFDYLLVDTGGQSVLKPSNQRWANDYWHSVNIGWWKHRTDRQIARAIIRGIFKHANLSIRLVTAPHK